MSEETLFHEALARPPGERAAFLDAACSGRPELRAAVDALLAAHEAPAGFLQRPLDVVGQLVEGPPDPAGREAAGPPAPEPDPPPAPGPRRAHRRLSGPARAGRPDRRTLHAPGEDRRGRHGRGLGRPAVRAGEA